MDPQYFFKSGLLIFTGRFLRANLIFSLDVPFVIVVTILFNFLFTNVLKEIVGETDSVFKNV
jgi:hypothetical protein